MPYYTCAPVPPRAPGRVLRPGRNARSFGARIRTHQWGFATFANGPTTAQRNLTNGRFALRWTRSHELGAPPKGDYRNEQSDALAAWAVQR
jgi:hypothetical protein